MKDDLDSNPTMKEDFIEINLQNIYILFTTQEVFFRLIQF